MYKEWTDEMMKENIAVAVAVKEIIECLNQKNFLIDEPMKGHTTFRIGGNASILVRPENIEQLKTILQICFQYDIPYFVMGNGSNLLVADAGFDGVVIQLYHTFDSMTITDGVIDAGAGCLLSGIANAAKDASLTGFEFAGGIPGTLGGAVIMNAGAYGGEMKDVVISVDVLTKEGDVLTFSGEEMAFGYRTSLAGKCGYIVLGAKLALKPGKQEEIVSRMKELLEARRSKQPLELPSAGSAFKRPEGYFAGKLIQDAGLAGFQVGDAAVSNKHCGFVVNQGNATAKDVKTLLNKVADTVEEQFGVRLEPEIKMLGDII